MSAFSSAELAAWLRETQHYTAGADSLHRIGGSVAGVNKALKAVDTGSLFWTEPANLDTLFSTNASATGNHDE